MWVYGVIGGSFGPYRPAGFGPPALTIVNPITHNLTPQTNDDDVHTHTQNPGGAGGERVQGVRRQALRPRGEGAFTREMNAASRSMECLDAWVRMRVEHLGVC